MYPKLRSFSFLVRYLLVITFFCSGFSFASAGNSVSVTWGAATKTISVGVTGTNPTCTPSTTYPLDADGVQTAWMTGGSKSNGYTATWSPNQVGTWTFTCSNNTDSTISDSATITVSCPNGTTWNGTACVVPVAGSAPVTTFTLDNYNLSYGATTVARWSATNNPTSCTASDDWSGPVAVSEPGLTTVPATYPSYTFTLACSNENGTSTPVTRTLTVCPQGTPTWNGSSCVAAVTNPGECGSGNGVTSASQPTGAAACKSPSTFSEATDVGNNWNWQCTRDSTVGCSAPKPVAETPPTGACASQLVTWGSCSATAPARTDASWIVITNTAPGFSGTAGFSCNTETGGMSVYPVSGQPMSPVCTPVEVPPTYTCNVPTDTMYTSTIVPCSGICSNGSLVYPSCPQPTKPDLIGGVVSITGHPTYTLGGSTQVIDILSGETVTVNGTIRNQGLTSTPGSFNNYIELTTITYGALYMPGVYTYTRIGQAINTAALASGASRGVSTTDTITLSPSIDLTAPGFPAPGSKMYYLRTCADRNSPTDTAGVVDEVFDDNNCQSNLTFLNVLPPPTGTLTLSAPTCVIPIGGSSCSVDGTWTTSNPVGTSAITSPTNLTFYTANNGGPSPLWVTGITTRTFYLYNNGTLLAQASLTATGCAAGSSWSGSSCVLIPGVTVGTCGSGAGGAAKASEPSGASLCSSGSPQSEVPLDTSTTWNWTCWGDSLPTSATCSTPKTSTLPPAPVVSVSLSTGYAVTGDYVFCNVSVTNASSCSVNPGSICSGSVNSVGTTQTGPAQMNTAGSFTHSVTCSGPGGSTSGSASLTVAPILSNPPCETTHWNCKPGASVTGVNETLDAWRWHCVNAISGEDSWCSEDKVPAVIPIPPGVPPSPASCTATHYQCGVDNVMSSNVETPTGWTWNCTGNNGGGTNACSQQKEPGVCGVSEYTCGANNTLSVGATSPTHWLWSCTGNNGGTTATCDKAFPDPTGTLTSSAPSCTIATGANACSTNLTWTTTYSRGTVEVTSNNPSASNPIFTGTSGGPSPATISGVGATTFYLYNIGLQLAQTTVTTSCEGTGAWDTVSSRCRDPRVESAVITGQYYPTGTLSLTCSNSNAYSISLNANSVITTIVPETPYTVPITLNTISQEGSYLIKCIYGSVEHQVARSYDAVPDPTLINLKISPASLAEKDDVVISWDTKFPTNACSLYASVVCANNACGAAQLAASTTLNQMLKTTTTDRNDPSGERLLQTAVKTVAPGHKDIQDPVLILTDWKALGKKTIEIQYTTDFTYDCGGGNKVTRRVKVTKEVEQ